MPDHDYFARIQEAETKERDAARAEHQKEREVLFANETFAISVFQAVAGGALIAGFSQSTALIALTSTIPFLLFITQMALALTSAVIAAFCKHQYKMWDVKARVASSKEEQHARAKRTGRYLNAMRFSMALALVAFVLGIVVLVGAAWARAVGPAPKQQAATPAVIAAPPCK